jgi:hypothetical protein
MIGSCAIDTGVKDPREHTRAAIVIPDNTTREAFLQVFILYLLAAQSVRCFNLPARFLPLCCARHKTLISEYKNLLAWSWLRIKNILGLSDFNPDFS